MSGFCRSFCLCFGLFFFFKQKTAYEMRISDWSSDVCSSDLSTPATPLPACIPASRKRRHERRAVAAGGAPHRRLPAAAPPPLRGAAAPPRPRRCLAHSLSRREPGGGGREIGRAHV